MLNKEFEMIGLIETVTRKLLKQLNLFYKTCEQNAQLRGQFKTSKMHKFYDKNNKKYNKIMDEYLQLGRFSMGKIF